MLCSLDNFEDAARTLEQSAEATQEQPAVLNRYLEHQNSWGSITHYHTRELGHKASFDAIKWRSSTPSRRGKERWGRG
jgi:hypothetical protein